MPAPRLGVDARKASLHTTNHALKVVAKWVLRNDDFVLFMKAAKIALESRAGKASDLIFPLLPEVIGVANPVIIDVGANMGQFASRVARQFPDGHIYSFEPVHSNVVGLERVLRWLRIKNVEHFTEAMCDTRGFEQIHIPMFAAYRDGTLAVLEGSKRDYDNVTYYVESVRTNTLDEFVVGREIKRVDLLKVDTEGAEERVVRGGIGMIDALLPTLYMEVLPTQPWVELLYSRGYRPFYTDGVKLHRPMPQETQNDLLLVHQSKLGRLTNVIRT
jgi:FkbM family methyltransferase